MTIPAPVLRWASAASPSEGAACLEARRSLKGRRGRSCPREVPLLGSTFSELTDAKWRDTKNCYRAPGADPSSETSRFARLTRPSAGTTHSRQPEAKSYRLRSLSAWYRLVPQADPYPHRSARGWGTGPGLRSVAGPPILAPFASGAGAAPPRMSRPRRARAPNVLTTSASRGQAHSRGDTPRRGTRLLTARLKSGPQGRGACGTTTFRVKLFPALRICARS